METQQLGLRLDSDIVDFLKYKASKDENNHTYLELIRQAVLKVYNNEISPYLFEKKFIKLQDGFKYLRKEIKSLLLENKIPEKLFALTDDQGTDSLPKILALNHELSQILYDILQKEQIAQIFTDHNPLKFHTVKEIKAKEDIVRIFSANNPLNIDARRVKYDSFASSFEIAANPKLKWADLESKNFEPFIDGMLETVFRITTMREIILLAAIDEAVKHNNNIINCGKLTKASIEVAMSSFQSNKAKVFMNANTLLKTNFIPPKYITDIYRSDKTVFQDDHIEVFVWNTCEDDKMYIVEVDDNNMINSFDKEDRFPITVLSSDSRTDKSAGWVVYEEVYMSIPLSKVACIQLKK